MNYYKKAAPRTPLWMRNGKPLNFERIDWDTGWLATEQPELIAELERAIREGRGAIEAATAEEYGEFLKKKGSCKPSPPPSREVIEAGAVPDTAGARAAAVSPDPAALYPAAPAAEAAEAPANRPAPRVGRRRAAGAAEQTVSI